MFRLLGPLFAVLAALRFGRTLIWLFFRPGGWAVLVAGAVVWLSFMKS
ncbi:MAG: hypothetical protein ABI459_10295 [Deltaproteobacteria bacterium]